MERNAHGKVLRWGEFVFFLGTKSTTQTMHEHCVVRGLRPRAGVGGKPTEAKQSAAVMVGRRLIGVLRFLFGLEPL